MPDVSFAPSADELRAKNGVFTRSYDGKDARRFAEFYKHPLSGKDYIHIILPGDKTTDIRREVKQKDTMEFPQEWGNYKSGADQFTGQLRLENVTWVNDATRRHLAAMNVFTVEQLAEVPDSALHNLPHGARDMRNKALQEVGARASAAVAEAQAAERREDQSRLAALEQQNAQLQQQIQALLDQQGGTAEAKPAKPAKKRGRPRKSTAPQDAAAGNTGDVAFSE